MNNRTVNTKRTILVIMFSVVFFMAALAIPLGAKPASAAPSGTLYKTPYGTYSFSTSYDVSESGSGWATLKLNTFITVNDKGVTITKATQTYNTMYPYYVKNKGTSVPVKYSSTSTQSAYAYGKYEVKFNPSSKIKKPWTSIDQVTTSFKVKSIDKKNKIVWFYVNYSHQ
ncbi:hypothetical protein [Bacillus sp. ISL-46]|uniref:hypothetical protein n=1 Tax=Bacillus sp. ISL-46 TaxID=2819129 RepID=UPI001BEC9615|nr:hypothetical protein [Bacillus sp. ISL-46]MBT2723030.1 hypothetical protein [Bacillus sp. ISL-46]